MWDVPRPEGCAKLPRPSEAAFRQERTMNGNDERRADDPGQIPVPRAAGTLWVRREGAVAIVATAIGALAVGALAVGAMSIGRLAIGRLTVGRTSLRSGQVRELRIARLIVEDLWIERPPTER
jgi:hypothetical protein